MSEILVPLTPPYTLIIPDDQGVLIMWAIGFIGMFILSLHLQDRTFRLTRATLLWSAVLSVLVLALTPFVGIFPRMNTILNPGDVPVLHLMFFAAVPWMVAGGVLGVLPAALLAGISGLLLAYLDTHNIFTPWIFMGLAIVFSWCVRQRYRTNCYKWLRFPAIAGVFSLVVVSPLVFLATVLSANGSVAARVAIAFGRFPLVMFSLGGMALIGGVMCVIVSAIAQHAWGGKSPLKPTPCEVNLKYRLLGYTLPIFLVLLVGVFISTWTFAQNNGRKAIVRQLVSASGLAATSLGDYLETTGSFIPEEMLHTQAFIRALQELEGQGGIAQIVSDNGTVYYQTEGQQSRAQFVGPFYTTATFYHSQSDDGQTWLNYFQPVDGTNLGIATTLPGWAIDEIAWQSTYPVLLITAGGMILILLAVWMVVSPIAEELDTVTAAIDAVSRGNFESTHLQRRVKSGGDHLNQSFRSMVKSQQHRLDHQAELLEVSNRVAGQQNLNDALHVILAAALKHGASSARMILTDAAGDIGGGVTHALGLGAQTKRFAMLDRSVVELAHREGALVLSGVEIGDKLPGAEEVQDVTCVVILPLKWQDQGLGVFWVVFPAGLSQCTEDKHYLQELSRMAGMAIVNMKTFQDLQSSRMLLESIFNLLPDAVLIADHNGQVVLQNKNAQAVLGLETGVLEGKSLSSLFSLEDGLELGWRVPSGTEAREIHLNNGKAFYLITSPIHIKPNQAGQAMIFKDLTQQRKEASLKSEFVTTVSHELRSPLTLILGYAKILRLTGNMNEQQDAYISNIIDGVQEMQNLVQKLLDIGRLEGGDSLAIQPISVVDVTHRVVESMDAQAKQKNIQMVVNIPDAPMVIEGDPTFLALALRNLMENAIKFSKMEGEVILSAWWDDDRVVFAVEDKGIGIAPLDQRHLFKKFSRTSAPTGQDQAGSGLGLVIVKSIAERHGGQVRVESQLGKGSIFYFEIPRKQSC
jgi:two-component system, OmpR family, phosphate regulon sensor histidine kinase PhoR